MWCLKAQKWYRNHTWGWTERQDAYEKDGLNTEAVEWHAVVLSAVAALSAGKVFGQGWDERWGAILDQQANIPTGNLLTLVEECVKEANRNPPIQIPQCAWCWMCAWFMWFGCLYGWFMVSRFKLNPTLWSKSIFIIKLVYQHLLAVRTIIISSKQHYLLMVSKLTLPSHSKQTVE